MVNIILKVNGTVYSHYNATYRRAERSCIFDSMPITVTYDFGKVIRENLEKSITCAVYDMID